MPPKPDLDRKDHKQLPTPDTKAHSTSAGAAAAGLSVQAKLTVSADIKIADGKERTELKQICFPLNTVNAGEESDDLASIKAIIGDATVVGLGEGTHGTAEFFKMKHRLLEYLVVEMGFSVFAMEANMAECQRINEYVLGGNSQLRTPFKETNWVWNTQEIFDMIEWMRRYNLTAKTKLQFTGFDMQSSEPSIEIIAKNLLRAEFKSDSINLRKTMDEIKKAIAVVRDTSQQQPKQDKLEAYKKLIQNINLLQAELKKQQKYLENKLGVTEYQWTLQNATLLEQSVECQFRLFGKQGGFFESMIYRDKAMADNVLWLQKQNPGAKIVLWAHNLHLYTHRMANSIPKPMGEHLASTLGDNYRAIGFLTYAGNYTATTKATKVLRRDWILSVPPEESLEGILKKVGYPIALLNLHATNSVNGLQLHKRSKTVIEINHHLKSAFASARFT